ncbi:unnamed protein product [Calicophoron daubneyi]|uniref:DUF7041 domain-containing protein n=1 Tax=Calicophoron daubneyi TaxID=300641 RepID=A0AAV2T5T6_CALDB
MAEQAEIDAVTRAKATIRPSIKIPEFLPTDPELWIGQLELQFTTLGITNQADKFAYLAANLPATLVVEVRDIVLHPPTERPYDTLRTAILQRATPSQESRLRQLLEGLQLGDKKPSQLLRQMRALAGPTIGPNESLLRQLWLQQLPPTVQPITCMLPDDLALDKVAEAVDKAIDAMRPEVHQMTQETVHPSTSATSENADTSTILQQIYRGINQLTTEIRASNARQRSRSRIRNNRPGSPRRRYSSATGICWYHFKFGPKARKCASPCNYKSPEN